MILTLSSKYRKNEGLVLSPAELQSIYFYGITIQDKSGKELDAETYRFFIQAAQQEVEKHLGIKLKKQIVTESLDFYGDEFRAFGFIPTSYPVSKPIKLAGFLGQVKQLEYPSEWLSSRKTSDGETFYRRVFIIPTQNTTISQTGVSMLYSGVLPNIGMMNWNNLPNYWSVTYCTGFDKVPRDIIDVIGKLASVGIFNIAGDLILGTAGIANYSLSIDGLSQSVGTTASAENAGYSARILMYNKEIKETLRKLESYYRNISIASM